MTMLFSGAELKVAFKNVQGNAETEIANYSDDYVLAHAIEDLTESVYGKYAVQAPCWTKTPSKAIGLTATFQSTSPRTTSTNSP